MNDKKDKRTDRREKDTNENTHKKQTWLWPKWKLSDLSQIIPYARNRLDSQDVWKMLGSKYCIFYLSDVSGDRGTRSMCETLPEDIAILLVPRYKTLGSPSFWNQMFLFPRSSFLLWSAGSKFIIWQCPFDLLIAIASTCILVSR